MANNTILHGWQDQSNHRGTFDILQSCVGTIFLLCWTNVCPNLPSPTAGFWAKSFPTLHLFLLAILGPDFAFMVAVGQLNAAWRAKKAFKVECKAEWNLRQCFFVNMGGVHLNFRDRSIAGLPPFPVDCEQLQYLVRHKYMPLPDVADDDISDRNKTDGLARSIAILQSLWFTANTFGRLAGGLCVTTLELTTLAFIFMMTCCSLCWWRKPMGITRPMTIYIDCDLSAVLHEANAPNKTFGRTPLSFLNRREWFMSQFWYSYTSILRRLRILPLSNSEYTHADYFPSIDFPETEPKLDFMFGWAIPAYSAIFMAAWNASFPTVIEGKLWRFAATTCFLYGFLGSLLAWYWHTRARVSSWQKAVAKFLSPKRNDCVSPGPNTTKSNAREASKLNALINRIKVSFDWMRNLSPEHDPAYAVPARLWILTTILCLAYCVSRAYILTEDFMALRSLPASAFQQVNWGQYSPIF